MAQQIKVRFLADGSSRVETVGFTGESCKQASEWIEKALASQTSDTNTAEMFQQPEVHQHLQEPETE